MHNEKKKITIFQAYYVHVLRGTNFLHLPPNSSRAFNDGEPETKQHKGSHVIQYSRLIKILPHVVWY